VGTSVNVNERSIRRGISRVPVPSYLGIPQPYTTEFARMWAALLDIATITLLAGRGWSRCDDMVTCEHGSSIIF